MITLRSEEGMRIGEEGFCLRRECINRNWKNATLAEVGSEKHWPVWVSRKRQKPRLWGL